VDSADTCASATPNNWRPFGGTARVRCFAFGYWGKRKGRRPEGRLPLTWKGFKLSIRTCRFTGIVHRIDRLVKCTMDPSLICNPEIGTRKTLFTMGYPGSAKWAAQPTLAVVLRYGLAVASVAVALGTTLILRHYNFPPRFISHFTMIAIAITFWRAGTGPGLLAFLLSSFGVSLLARNHLLLPGFPLESFLVFYAVFSLIVGWFSASRRRAEQLLSEARDNLEIRVAERTSELRKALEEIKELRDRLYQENLALKEDLDQASTFEEIVGSSATLRRVLSQVAKVASTDSTVLILGETGTGKELVARAIHNRSNRSDRAFIRVNCAAIPPSLIASELFGHEKGAFTGAVQRRLGRFELANGGTIFLDEIGELPAETQITLLRVLQERELERVGGSELISVDVRVLAATNRDLNAAVAAGTFRQDLFYRLNVFPIEVPPLRERLDDIPILVEYLIDRYAKKTGKTITNITKRTLEVLQAYDWPGNVRELQNVVERAIVVCEGTTFSVDETWLRHDRCQERKHATLMERPLGRLDAHREKEIIVAALAESKGRIAGPAGAAAKLAIPRTTLESKIRALGINKHLFKS
jgi:DNA-binding NtrC family response regulator